MVPIINTMSTAEKHLSSPLGPQPPPKHLANEPVRRQYEEIGIALMIAEAGSFAVGIPWIFPNYRWWTLAQKYQGPPADHIRYSLVTVKTKTLEAYCEDLESYKGCSVYREDAPYLDEITEQLYIDCPSLPIRYSLCALMFTSLCNTCSNNRRHTSIEQLNTAGQRDHHWNLWSSHSHAFMYGGSAAHEFSLPVISRT